MNVWKINLNKNIYHFKIFNLIVFKILLNEITLIYEEQLNSS